MTELARTAAVDGRDLGAFIPSELDDYGLDPYEWRVYCRIVRRAGGGGVFYESAAAVAGACGMGERKVREALSLLADAGLIGVVTKRDGQVARYRLTPSSEWAPADRLPELRARLKRDRKRTRPTPDAPVDNPAGGAPDPGRTDRGRTDRGPSDRTPRSHRPGTPVAPTDEGTPRRYSQKDHHHPPDGDDAPPVDNDRRPGGGRRATLLAEIHTQLDDVDRARLAAEPDGRRRALLDEAGALLDRGWPPRLVAETVCRGNLDTAGSIAAVLTKRAHQLARADLAPPARGAGPAAHGVPADVLTALEQQATAAAFTDAAGIDLETRAQVLAELVADWHAQQAGPAPDDGGDR